MKTEMAVGVLFGFSTIMEKMKKRLPCSIHVKARPEPILTSKAPI
jgi:hypothetical protein